MKPMFLVVLVCISSLASAFPAPASFELDRPSAARAGALDVLPDMGLVSLATRSGSRGHIVLSAAEHYGLQEVRSFAVGTRLSLGDGELVLDGSVMGSSLYREQSLNVGWGTPVGEGGAIRLSAHVMEITAAGLESRWAVALDPAVLWLLRGRVAAELALANATGVSMGDSPVSSSAHGRLALVLDDAVLGLAMESEPGFPYSFSMGLELRASDQFRLRAGGGTEPGRVAVGFGIGAKRPRRPVVDLAWQWHPRLGGSTFVSISFGL